MDEMRLPGLEMDDGSLPVEDGPTHDEKVAIVLGALLGDRYDIDDIDCGKIDIFDELTREYGQSALEDAIETEARLLVDE